MKFKNNKTTFIFVIILVLLFQLMRPSIAQADGETPPISTEATPTDTPVETVDATPEPLTLEIVPLDNQAVNETDQPTLLESLAEAPAETDVVVLDENGQTVSLAEQTAADIIAQSDPMWCPVGVTTVTSDCVSDATVTGLLAKISELGSDPKNEAGIIYFFTINAYNTPDVVFDGNLSSMTDLSQNALTLQGGWDGNTADGADILLSGNSYFVVPIWINLWNADVTINNIYVDDSTGTALTIDTTKNVTINDSSFSNTSSGIYTGGSGADILANEVTINNSIFDNNAEDGARINANTTTLNNNIFTNNQSSGAYLANTTSIFAYNNYFGNNSSAGLSILDNTSIVEDSADIAYNEFSGQSNGSGLSAYFTDYVFLTCNSFYANEADTDFYSNLYVFDYSCDEEFLPNWYLYDLYYPTESEMIDVSSSENTVEGSLDCSQLNRFDVNWPNGDRFRISCVPGGRVRITRVDSTDLATSLPTGYEYVAAYKIEVFKDGMPLPVMPVNGFIETLFVPPSADSNYDIMIWDEKTNNWIVVNDYQKNPSGAPTKFPLSHLFNHSQDERVVLEGARFILNGDHQQGDFTTNFSGDFVLVRQR